MKIIKIYWGDNKKIQFVFHRDIYCDSYSRKYVGFEAYILIIMKSQIVLVFL